MPQFRRLYQKSKLPIVDTTVTEDTVINRAVLASITVHNKATSGLYAMINRTTFGTPVTVKINVAYCYQAYDGTTLLAEPYNAGTEYTITSGKVTTTGTLAGDSTFSSGDNIQGSYSNFIIYNSGGEIGGEYRCLAKGTKVTLADYSVKNVEDITYDDLLLVWDFDLGILSSAYPIWIKKPELATWYTQLAFSDGTILKTVGKAAHRIYNIEKNKFTYPIPDETPLGTHTIKSNKQITTLIKTKIVREPIEYYNIITKRHLNLFANGILTSCRLNNMYPIENLKYKKDNRELVSREAFSNLTDLEFKGLRIAEQPVFNSPPSMTLEGLQEYVRAFMKVKTPIIELESEQS